MKLSSILLAVVALTPFAQADFDIYSVEVGYPGSDNIRRSWQIFDSNPSCSQAQRATEFGNYNDVSGKTKGVRCKGTCYGTSSPSKISQLEMHFSNNPLYHMTIYKDRGYKMYGLNGNVYGDCKPFPGNSYTCAGASYLWGRRKFRCKTKKSARQITGKN